MSKESKRITLVVGIQIFLIALFILGDKLESNSIHIFYQSYFADVIIPFGFYFLLSIKGDQSKYFDKWWKKAFSVFFLCTTSEILQYFGIFAFARVFDPVDILMYGVGVLIAAFVDRQIFTQIFSFWK